MSYEIIVVKITNLVKAPNSDNLMLASFDGTQVVVGKDSYLGQIGLFFNCDGILNDEFCRANDLYPRFENGIRVGGGFFTEGKPRIRAQKFRGNKSDGYFCPIEYLNYTGYNLSKLKIGDKFNELNGKIIAEKYVNQATLKAMKQNRGNQQPKSKMFLKHFETAQLRFYIDKIPVGSKLIISEKVHGTSHRVGNCLEQLNLGFFKRNINKIVPIFSTERWNFLSGTRNVILNYREDKPVISNEDAWLQYRMEKKKLSCKKFYLVKNNEAISDEMYRSVFPEDNEDAAIFTLDFIENKLPGFKKWFSENRELHLNEDFHGDDFRERVAAPFKDKLRKGEVVYYEVAGFERIGKPIMETPNTLLLKDKEFTKKYGENMVFKYGCMDGNFNIFVYRIAQVSTEGFLIDLAWEDVKKRCIELGVKHVPEICPPFIYDGNVEKLREFVESVSDGESSIDKSHIREGVCVRVDGNINLQTYKNKGFQFKVLEGIIKDNDNYIDMEESS